MNISLDPGFGGFKTAAISGDIYTATVRAVVGAGSLNGTHLSTGLGRGKAHEKPIAVQFDGVQYLVGNNVHRHTRPIERLDFQRLGNGPELRALFYATLYQLQKTTAAWVDTAFLNVLVGLPVQVLADNSLASSVRSQLRSWMVAYHTFTANDETFSVSVKSVKTMAQPLGAFFAWGMDEAGQWVQSDNPRAKFAVADIGFNTLDLFVIEDGRVNERYSSGETLGMRRANSFIKSTVRERYGVSISLQEADALTRLKKPVLHHSQGSTDLTPLVQQALADTFGGIASFMEDTWGNARQFRRVIITGGGADALRDKLLALYPHAIIMPDAQSANSVGLAKFAQRDIWK